MSVSPDDDVERGAKFVAHAGDELRLVLARQLELPVLVLDFVEQSHILDRDHRLIGESRRHSPSRRSRRKAAAPSGVPTTKGLMPMRATSPLLKRLMASFDRL
jgi:hypothetical protein